MVGCRDGSFLVIGFSTLLGVNHQQYGFNHQKDQKGELLTIKHVNVFGGQHYPLFDVHFYHCRAVTRSYQR